MLFVHGEIHHDRQPTWSPDGERIAFVSDRDDGQKIYSIKADGSDLRQITRGGMQDSYPSWSPDGEKIAYSSERFGHCHIYLVAAEGEGEEKGVTNNPAREECPRFSPDGSKIAFHSNLEGHFDIYVVGAEGGTPINLTQGSANDMMPSWSPDGTKIAFQSDREDVASIWVMNSDGSEPRKLIENPSGCPSWSPDGAKIAYVAEKAIWVMDADGSNKRVISQPADDCGRPAFSPDGKIIAFDSERSGRWRIQLVQADGSGQRELSSEPDTAVQPQRLLPQAPVRAPRRDVYRDSQEEAEAYSPRSVIVEQRRKEKSRIWRRLVSLLLLFVLLAGVGWGVHYFLQNKAKGVVVKQDWVKELDHYVVSYTIKNEGESGIIKVKVSLIMEDGTVKTPAFMEEDTAVFKAGETKHFVTRIPIEPIQTARDLKIEVSPR